MACIKRVLALCSARSECPPEVPRGLAARRTLCGLPLGWTIEILRLLGEHQSAYPRARIAKAGDDDDVTFASLAAAERDLPRGLPQIELADLPGAIDRALISPRRANSGRTLRR